MFDDILGKKEEIIKPKIEVSYYEPGKKLSESAMPRHTHTTCNCDEDNCNCKDDTKQHSCDEDCDHCDDDGCTGC